MRGLILHNANIITLDPARPRASALAAQGGKVVVIGGEADVKPFLRPGMEAVDCQGRTVAPGFNDAHTHILAYMGVLLGVDCSPAAVRSIADIQEVIRKRAAQLPPGTWIRATGYSEFHLAEKRHPNRWDLDAAAPHHPVRLMHRSSHAVVLNSLGLELAGLRIDTPEPEGAMFERDLESGELNGLLYEMNTYLNKEVLPPFTEAELKEGAGLICQKYLSQGITSIQDATVHNGPAELRLLQRLKEKGYLVPRVTAMVGVAFLPELEAAPNAGDKDFRLGALKIVLDETTGDIFPAPKDLEAIVLAAHRRGYQLAIHAVTETSLEAAIAALERALAAHPRAGHRHRIEHCSVCPPRLLERLKRLGAIISTQPVFLYHSGERYLADVPPADLPWLYRVRSLAEAGLTLVGSSDCPVTPPEPMLGVYAAATRRSKEGSIVGAQEAISPLEALRMHIWGGAYATFEEDVKGSLAVGQAADMVVISDDPLACLPEGMRDITVEMTILGGQVVWEKR